MDELTDINALGVTCTGLARIDGRIRNLVNRLEPGDIAIIDQADLDRASAHALASARPAAVLNAAPSTSGRHLVLGPKILIDAGILVIDDLGADIMTVREGQTLQISGGHVLRDGVVIASGHTLRGEDLASTEREQRRTMSNQIGSFAASIDEYLMRDGDVLRGGGLTQYSRDVKGRLVLVVLDDADADADLSEAKRWIADAAPVVIGVDAGANIAARRGYQPRIVVGDMDRVDDKVLRKAKRRVLRRGYDGLAAGKERLDRMGLSYDEVEMAGVGEDLAVLVATHSGADAIVLAGGHHDLNHFVDRGRSAMAPSFFSRLTAGNLIIPAHAVAATHKPRISGGWLTLLLIAVAACLGVAIWSTPWGRDVFNVLTTWVRSFISSAGASASGVHLLSGLV